MEELLLRLEQEYSLTVALHDQLRALQDVIDNGEIAQIDQAAHEVSQCLEAVREAEDLRIWELQRLARSYGLARDSSINDMMSITPPAIRDQIQVLTSQLSTLAAAIEGAGRCTSRTAGACLSDLETFGVLRLNVPSTRGTV